MSLHLAVGAANAGKTAYVIGKAREFVSHGERARLVLPAEPDVSRAILLAARDLPVGLDIGTFDDLLNGIWMHHGDGRAVANAAHRIAVLEESVRKWQPDTIPVAAGSKGTMRLLATFVQRCAESTRPLEPQKLGRGLARDLAAFAAIYQQLLREAGFIERAEAHRVAVSLLDKIHLPGLLAIDGFTGLTAAQESFAVEAAKRTTVVVTLVHDEAVPATSGAAVQVLRLLRAGGQLVELASAAVENAELARIGERLGCVGSANVAAGGSVVLSEAWGRAAEAARIVREVQDANSTGVPPGSIAVVFRDVAPHLQELKRALAEAKIEAEFDARVPFRSMPLGRTLLLALRGDSLEHHELMDLLRSPYSPISHEDLDAFDAHERGRRGSRSSLSATTWLTKRQPSASAFLRRLHLGKPGELTVDRLFSLVSAMIEDARATPGATKTDLMLDATVARSFIDAAEALAATGSLNPSTLHSVLEQSNVAISSTDDPGRVQVMSAERARARQYRCVIVGGLQDGEFPRLAGENVLGDPSLLVQFADSGVDLGPRSGVDEERLLFYQVITRATERLVLSRQTNDESGRPLRGSVFIDELLDLYRDPESRDFFAGEPPVRRLGLDGLAEHPDAPRSERRVLRSAAAEGGNQEDTRLTDARRRTYRAQVGLSEAAKRNAAERAAFSASELETYLKCPFMWCVQRLVQPRELDDRLDAAATGRLAHDILRRFYEVFPERTARSRVTDDCASDAIAVHDEVALDCLRKARPASAVEAAMCRGVVRRTRQMVVSDAAFLPGFVPVEHEWSFGAGPEGEPVDLGGYALVGRIDRLDSDGQRVVLTDYKSGTIAAEHGAARHESEGLIQLSLYAAVVHRVLGLEVLGGVYRSFKGGKPRGFVRADIDAPGFVSTDLMAAEDLLDHIDRGNARARDAVDRMRSGEIAPDPLGGRCPRYCAAASFCEKWSPGRG